MDTPKETYRNVKESAKKTLRDADGHDLTDDIGNAGDEIRKDLGNAGDQARERYRQGRRRGQGLDRTRAYGPRPRTREPDRSLILARPRPTSTSAGAGSARRLNARASGVATCLQDRPPSGARAGERPGRILCREQTVSRRPGDRR